MSDFSFKDAVCVETERIFDSCSDRDCITDLTVTLNSGSTLTDDITVIKSESAEVTDVCMNVDSVPFNKGFYSVDITYTFELVFNAYKTPCGTPTQLTGTAIFSKRVILFGSDGGTKTYCAGETPLVPEKACSCSCCAVLPKACLRVVEPIVLDSKICSTYTYDDNSVSGDNCCKRKVRFITVTLGLFSIVQLSRPVSVMIPVYDYCVPTKECSCGSDTPCEVFEKIKFPTDEFFPPSFDRYGSPDCGCGRENGIE